MPHPTTEATVTEHQASPCQPGSHTNATRNATASTNAGWDAVTSPGIRASQAGGSGGIRTPGRLRDARFKFRAATYGSSHGVRYC